MSKKVTKQHILAFINASRIPGREISLENLKKNTLTAEERFTVEKRWGAKVVKEIFGEPSHLQKAEMRILAIEEGEIDAQKKCEYIIEIAYAISNACGLELDSSNEVWEKYAMLYCSIPIVLVDSATRRPLDYSDFKEKEKYVSVDELKTAAIWIRTKEAESNLEKKAYLKYIFELTYISLKKIFPEVKQEIMGI